MKTTRSLAIVTLAGALAFPAAAPRAQEQAPAGDAEALARRLQQKYDTVKDFSARFVHTYQGGVLRKKVTERGRLVVKKPGRMRWTYEKPEEKTFVSDGRKLYSYIPADRQVYVTTVPSEDEASTPALFLAGKGNLLRDFDVSLAPPPPEAAGGSVALALIPRTRERDYDSLILAVDERTLQLRSLVAEDRQGGRSAFAFSGLEENVGIDDSAFVFKIPRGVDVITDQPQSR